MPTVPDRERELWGGSRGQTPAVFSTFERLLADKLVLDPRQIENLVAKALRLRFWEKVYYLDTITRPAELRILDLGSLAKELAKAVAAVVSQGVV